MEIEVKITDKNITLRDYGAVSIIKNTFENYEYILKENPYCKLFI